MPTQRIAEEYPPKSGILIAQKTNPSGSLAYRVDIAASLTGADREQRQFPTKAKAQRYAKQRHAEIVRHGHAAFSLSAQQRADALKAFAILRSCELSLEDAAKFAAIHRATQREQLTVSELYRRFMAAPGRRKAKAVPRRPLTIINLTWRLNRFEKIFGKRVASEIRHDEFESWFRSLGKLSAISFNNYRRVLHAMFSFGVAQGYTASNPMAKIPLYVVPHKAPPILTVEQAGKLVAAAVKSENRLGLLGFVVLGLFAGLRRAELEQLDWSAVKWERKMVTVDGAIAKSGSIRNVTLSDNALAWLRDHTTKKGPLTPQNMKTRLRELWKLTGFKKDGRNELRHSFASYHYDLHQNGPLTAAQLGHSTGTHLLFEHYRSLVPLGEGRKYFSITPHTSTAQPEKCITTPTGTAAA
jgi:integrase